MAARPCKCRRVEHEPKFTYFKPAGVPLYELEEVILTVEEIESIRLKDLEELDQEDCAARMEVSRPTFQRILGQARKKIASALVEGHAIKVAGGNFELAARYFCCQDCGHKWELPFGNGQCGKTLDCPNCQGSNIARQPTPK